MKREDVKVSAVPKIEGLTIEDFLDYASKKKSLLSYLPEQRDWLHLDKHWICDVLYTLDEAGIQDMIDQAEHLRREKLIEKRDLTIALKPEFLEALNHSEVFSCNSFLINSHIVHKGRTVSFLKDSSKRKRKRSEIEEVKVEELELKQDKNEFLKQFKRIK